MLSQIFTDWLRRNGASHVVKLEGSWIVMLHTVAYFIKCGDKIQVMRNTKAYIAVMEAIAKEYVLDCYVPECNGLIEHQVLEALGYERSLSRTDLEYMCFVLGIGRNAEFIDRLLNSLLIKIMVKPLPAYTGRQQCDLEFEYS